MFFPLSRKISLTYLSLLLVLNYGNEYPRILEYIDENPEWAQPVSPRSEVLQAEVIHAIRDEMAEKLADVVRRRTELGSAGCPEEHSLKICANLVGEELDWDKSKKQTEIEETKSIYIPAF